MFFLVYILEIRPPLPFRFWKKQTSLFELRLFWRLKNVISKISNDILSIYNQIHLSTSQHIGKLGLQMLFPQHLATGGCWQIFDYINGYFVVSIFPNSYWYKNKFSTKLYKASEKYMLLKIV